MIEQGMRKIRFSPADAATSMNLVCGLLSMVMAAQDQMVQAVWLIVMAMVFDSIDGNLAKMFNTTSEFGRQYDSLADMVSFGVAPAFLYSEFFIRESFSLLFFIAPATYVICAATRLARFNLRPPVRGYFQGLPSPASALGACLMILAALQNKWVLMPIFSAVAWVLMGSLALLMISEVPYPKPFGAEYKRWRPFFILGFASFPVVWIVAGRESAFLELILCYICGAPFYGLALSRKVQAAFN